MENIQNNNDPVSGEVKIVKYLGKNIIYQNFSHLQPDECIKVMEMGRKIFNQQAPNSTLGLVDVTGTDYNTEAVAAIKNYAKANKPFAKKSAVVGVDGLMKIIFQSVLSFSGRNDIQIKNSIQEAKDWLVSD